MLPRGISIKARGSTEFVSSDTLNLGIKTVNVPLLANRRTGKEDVLGKDGTFYFDDSFGIKMLSFQVEYFSNISYAIRQHDISKIASYFYNADEMILNYDPSKTYKVKLLTEINNNMLTTYNSFTVQFEAYPVQKNIYDKGFSPTWESAGIPWNQAEFLWGGYTTVFNNISANTNITLDNDGTYTVKPIIVLTGGIGNSIVITNNTTNESLTYKNLNNEIIYIDCDEKLVYNVSKTNKRNNLSGKYISLEVGTNNINIRGSYSNLSVEFDYNENYL